ncbi:MAG: TIGR03618 family F420-dependent PPOX class oxidoreductase [Chloroflexi bacterium]|nr:TIGR03618 family F420-dependent PPOX class oxidoreductase [Chloroflexota bacterium]MCC6893989.1 TIGR03618 family F420-dependent PPOX class oxidoreductase [Anaerolineae bacterium]
MIQVPADYTDLLTDDRRSFMMLTTLMSDGSPVVTPIWFTVEGDNYLITTHPDSLKARNMRERPQVAFAILHEGSMARYVAVRGLATEALEMDAKAVQARIVRKYEGHDPTIEREEVVFRITPGKTSAFDYTDYVA